MPLNTIAIISPGDMGHTVGQVLKTHGLRVVTCLEERSARTRAFAQKAGIEDLPDYDVLVEEADMILSILVPGEALTAAQDVTVAQAQVEADLIYVDCNAIAPATTCVIGEMMEEAGARFVDASIIGPPPRKPGVTRFYASGPNVDEFASLADYGLDIRVLGEEIGQASAIKMCYAASTKGYTALLTTLATAAQSLGVLDALMQEFGISQPRTVERLQRVPYVPRKARRFVGEMEEIAATFESVGLSPKIMQGAADIYRLIGATSLADANPEDESPPPELVEMLNILLERLSQD
jgi:3-hydroxyisobutyrate dehydrogenase-like beta-hydroxyacid dehydrogenase